MDRNIKKLISV